MSYANKSVQGLSPFRTIPKGQSFFFLSFFLLFRNYKDKKNFIFAMDNTARVGLTTPVRVPSLVRISPYFGGFCCFIMVGFCLFLCSFFSKKVLKWKQMELSQTPKIAVYLLDYQANKPIFNLSMQEIPPCKNSIGVLCKI